MGSDRDTATTMPPVWLCSMRISNSSAPQPNRLLQLNAIPSSGKNPSVRPVRRLRFAPMRPRNGASLVLHCSATPRSASTEWIEQPAGPSATAEAIKLGRQGRVSR
jgi:hypothetical protein